MLRILEQCNNKKKCTVLLRKVHLATVITTYIIQTALPVMFDDGDNRTNLLTVAAAAAVQVVFIQYNYSKQLFMLKIGFVTYSAFPQRSI